MKPSGAEKHFSSKIYRKPDQLNLEAKENSSSMIRKNEKCFLKFLRIEKENYKRQKHFFNDRIRNHIENVSIAKIIYKNSI